MNRSKDRDGVAYYLTKDEDKVVQSFLAKLRDATHLPNDIAEFVHVFTDSRGVWDPKHNQDAKCARRGCGHTYERHFDTYADMEPVGCEYCERYTCSTFVEPV